MDTKKIQWIGVLTLCIWTGCEPLVEDGIDLPSPPDVNANWYFLPPDTLRVTGYSSGVIKFNNTVVFEAETNDDVFLHLWDFGNGRTSAFPVDTMIYYEAGTYGISYQGHSAGGMYNIQDSIRIDRTIERPCDGYFKSLTGCSFQKTWKLSQEEGSIAVGPEPESGLWYSSPADSLQTFQADDRWQLSEDGVFKYNNSGGTVNPFEGYSETLMTVGPTTFVYEPDGGEYQNSPHFVIGDMMTQSNDPLCGFMGVWDSGPDYNIVEINEDRMVLTVRQQDGDCIAGQGWFTLTFVAAF